MTTDTNFEELLIFPATTETVTEFLNGILRYMKNMQNAADGYKYTDVRTLQHKLYLEGIVGDPNLRMKGVNLTENAEKILEDMRCFDQRAEQIMKLNSYIKERISEKREAVQGMMYATDEDKIKLAEEYLKNRINGEDQKVSTVDKINAVGIVTRISYQEGPLEKAFFHTVNKFARKGNLHAKNVQKYARALKNL